MSKNLTRRRGDAEVLQLRRSRAIAGAGVVTVGCTKTKACGQAQVLRVSASPRELFSGATA